MLDKSADHDRRWLTRHNPGLLVALMRVVVGYALELVPSSEVRQGEPDSRATWTRHVTIGLVVDALRPIHAGTRRLSMSPRG